MKKIQNVYEVVSHKNVKGTAYFHLVLEAPELARQIKPGQFIHIKVSDGFEPLFRRPFSVFRAKDGKIEVFYEPVGKGTTMLSQKKTGDKLDIIGPLGKPFTMPDDSVTDIVFVGGGIGVAPFLIFSDAIKDHPARKFLLYGGRTKSHTFSLSEFKKNGLKTYVSTDDGSVGEKGRISVLFDRIPKGPGTMIYTCGPKPMMSAVKTFALENKIRGEASMEEIMACGLGACLGCSIPTANGYRTVCHDGPVFALAELEF